MTVSRLPYWAHEEDTDEVKDLAARHLVLDRIIDRAHKEQRAIDEKIDELRTVAHKPAQRPTVAELDRIKGMVGAASRDDKSAYAQHRFEKHAKGWWCSIRVCDMYSRRTGGRLLWDYSEEDIARLIDAFHDAGAVVEDHWAHPDGHSFVFSLKEPNA